MKYPDSQYLQILRMIKKCSEVIFSPGLQSMDLNSHRGRFGWVVMLFSTCYPSTMSECRRQQTDKSLAAVCLGSPGRCIMVMCDIHQLLWLVGVYAELKWLSGRTPRRVDLLSRATAINNFRKDIGLSKLSLDSTLYHKVAEKQGILSIRYFHFASLT
jgi:hypothetical protein